MFDAGGPHDRGMVMYDTRRALLVEQYDVAVAHVTRRGEPVEDVVSILCKGRINRPPDDQVSGERPAEEVEHLHMLSFDLAADLIANLHAMAGRDGRGEEFSRRVRDLYDDLERQGFTVPGVPQ
jgi:hypothetical protein